MATNPTGGNTDNTKKDIAQSTVKLENELFASIDAAKDLAQAMGFTNSALKKLVETGTEIKNTIQDVYDLSKSLGNKYIEEEEVLKRIDAVNMDISKNEEKRKAILSSYNTIAGQSFTMEKAIEDVIDRVNRGKMDTFTAEENIFYVLATQLKTYEGIAEELEKIKGGLPEANAEFVKMNFQAKQIAKVFEKISSIPFLGDILDFKKIGKAFSTEGLTGGFRSLGLEIIKVVKNPLFSFLLVVTAIVGAFKALVKIAFDYDKIVTDIANNTALSKTSAVGMLDAYRDISNQNLKLVDSLNSGYLSVKNQANALIELGSTLETNAMFTNEMVQNQILLTKQMKMSAEEAAGIQKFSLLTGQSAEKILNTAMKQNTTVISYRKIFSQIAKINSELAVAYKNNPELIAKAVVQANKLGMSLEDTQKISKSLLDFENSIAGELEAELLLGKQFNFEKARALALDGKSAEAAAELVNQMGGLNALTNMNVIQRDRLAASIGLSAEELTKSAREQAVLNALGEQNRAGLEERYEYLRKTGDIAGLEQLKAEAARKEGGQALLQDIARANLQDRFNESMEKLKQVFTEVAAGPMIKIISGFAKMLENTTLVKAILASVAALAASIAISMAIATGGLALVGGVIAGGAALSMIGSDANSAGASDMAVATLPNRTLPTSNTTTAGGGASGNDATLKAIQDLHDTVKKGGNVYMDSTKVGTAMGMSSHKSGR